jgi:HlyD family secretion protein
MKRTLIISGIIAVVAIITLIVFNKIASKKDGANLYAQVKKGEFDIVVTTTGELQAENSTDIRGPDFTQMRYIRGMDIKIQDLVPEGTEVKTGDLIATLDKTSFDNTLKDELDKLTTYETNLEMKTLDTAVTLSGLRDNIKNLTYSVEEAKITLAQSKYEPPTTIRQAEIALDKAERSLDQAIKGYSLRVQQAKSDMRTTRHTLEEQQRRVSDLQDILSKFDIRAPSPGMVIYKRDRMGNKRKIGSTINPWDNVVATLPDMSSMLSKTYVNEIDVSKVKPGQKVDIVVDAFPDKSYTGEVISVANIGEQLPNADAKVFEVLIKVDGSDPILRPSMTTGNKIITKVINDVTYIPLECVQAGTDSIPFVYLRNGDKQVVVLGESNENNVIVEKGLDPGTLVYLSTPENPGQFKLVGQDLIPIIRERARIKKEEEKKQRDEAAMSRLRREAGRAGGPGMQQPGGMRGPGAMQPGDTASRNRYMRSGQPGQGGFRRDTVQTNRRMNPSGENEVRRNGTQPAAGDR